MMKGVHFLVLRRSHQRSRNLSSSSSVGNNVLRCLRNLDLATTSTTAGRTTTMSTASISSYAFYFSGTNKNIANAVPPFRVNLKNKSTSAVTTTNDDTDSISGTTVRSMFAVVDHGKAYEESMKGPHGKQLALAEVEGYGRDDPPYDPFAEDEEEDVFHVDTDADLDDEEEEEEYAEEKGAIGKKEDGRAEKDGDGEAEDEEEGYDEDDEDDINGDANNMSRRPHPLYNTDGSVPWKKSDLFKFRAGKPSGGLFAIIEIANSQFKVTVDDLLIINRLKPIKKYEIGTTHTLKNENILLLGSSHLTIVGMPYINAPGAEVDIMIEEITRDEKIIVFKKRRRKHSQRRNGFRRDVTFVRILDIRLPEQYQDHYHIQRDNPIEEKE